MFELVQVGENSYYVNSGAKAGVYVRPDGDAWLVDSGGDKDAGRRIRKLLDEKGWRLRGIVNTHSNADHIGGNQYLQRQSGCKVFAPGIEAAFTKYPVLEPSFLYGGYPFAALRHKFLLAQESDAVDITDKDFPPELKTFPLPGHFFDMIGVLTPDGTAFVADCVSSAATLEKYRFGFLYDVEKYLQTLDAVQTLGAKIYVPAHAEPVGDMAELARINRGNVLENAGLIVSLCREPIDAERLLKAVFDRCGLTLTAEQYVLVGSTVRSYLSYLENEGRVENFVSDNLLLWRAKSDG